MRGEKEIKMGRVLIRQPNGKLMVWSTFVEEPVGVNMTKEDYIEFKKEEAEKQALYDLERARDSNYLYDLIFTYNMDDEEIEKFRRVLINAGYSPKIIDKIIKKQDKGDWFI